MARGDAMRANHAAIQRKACLGGLVVVQSYESVLKQTAWLVPLLYNNRECEFRTRDCSIHDP